MAHHEEFQTEALPQSTLLIRSCGTKVATHPDALLRRRSDIVQIVLRGLNAVLLVQSDFRWRAHWPYLWEIPHAAEVRRVSG